METGRMNQKKSREWLVGWVVAVWAMSLVGTSLRADEINWSGSTSVDWATAANWGDGTGSVPTSSDIATFVNGYTNAPTVATAGVAGLQFDKALTITGGSSTPGLSIGASGITISSAVGASGTSINSAVTLTANQTWANNSAGLFQKNAATSGALDTNGYELTVDGTGITALRGAITGAGSIVKIGSGELQIGRVGLNTFSGGTIIKAGTVRAYANTTAYANAAFGTGGVTLGDTTGSESATLALNNSGGSGGTTIAPYALTVAAGNSGTLTATPAASAPRRMTRPTPSSAAAHSATSAPPTAPIACSPSHPAAARSTLREPARSTSPTPVPPR